MNKDAPEAVSSPAGVLAEIDRLLREDLEISRRMEAVERARDARLRYLAQRTREETKPFEVHLAPLRDEHARLRNAILAFWAEGYAAETTLDIPSGKVSRRNYREITVKDKAALLDALDRLDRLDLVDYTFDEKGLLQLLDEGKLKSGPMIEVRDNYNLQYRPSREAP